MFHPSCHNILYQFWQKGKIRHWTVDTHIVFTHSSFFWEVVLLLHIWGWITSLLLPVSYLWWQLWVAEVCLCNFLRSQVGSGSKSGDLFGEVKIITFTSLTEAGWNTCSFSPLKLLSAFTAMLHKSTVEVHNKSSHRAVIFLMKNMLNLAASCSAEVELLLILSTFFYFHAVFSDIEFYLLNDALWNLAMMSLKKFRYANITM